MSELRSDLPALPERMKRLPIDHRGFPIPWFVATLGNGERDFRVADERKKVVAIRKHLCWVCGEPLGRFKAFVIGPMCAVNRVTSEPPCHLDCAEFSAKGCPFLARPRMRRNEKDLPTEAVDAPGTMISRNPGVACIWVCNAFKRFAVGDGWLIRLEEPTQVKWLAEGREATREQVMASIQGGYSLLKEMADQEGPEAVSALEQQLARAMPFLPAVGDCSGPQQSQASP
jgi:hypothetical protein